MFQYWHQTCLAPSAAVPGSAVLPWPAVIDASGVTRQCEWLWNTHPLKELCNPWFVPGVRAPGCEFLEGFMGSTLVITAGGM